MICINDLVHKIVLGPLVAFVGGGELLREPVEGFDPVQNGVCGDSEGFLQYIESFMSLVDLDYFKSKCGRDKLGVGSFVWDVVFGCDFSDLHQLEWLREICEWLTMADWTFHIFGYFCVCY